MGRTVQSFLGWMTHESSGQITEAMRSTAVHGREIGQGQGLPPPPQAAQKTCLFTAAHRTPRATARPEESTPGPGAVM